MDNKRFGEIIGASVASGVQPTAEAVASVLTDQELLEAVHARNLNLSPALGSIASEGATKDVAPTPLTPEALAEQLDTAYEGYETVAKLLNGGRKKKEQIPVTDQETLAEEFKTWLSADKVEYVAKAMEADPELRFTLVATPNVVATADEIIAIAKEFGKNQPQATYVWSDIYGKYTPEQLSGTDPSNGNSAKFSLVPNKLDPALQGTVAQQRTRLARLQEDNSFLGVPSVLEDMAFWNTLRASGDGLTTGNVFDRTYVRHFDLPEKRFGDWSGVPASYVGVGGGPNLSRSSVDFVNHARVSVG